MYYNRWNFPDFSTKSDGVSIYYFLLTTDYFLQIFRPKAMVVGNKNGNLKIFFIPYHTRTYGENAVYIFVDFRIKRAGTFNYRGRAFSVPGRKGKSKGKSKKVKKASKCHSEWNAVERRISMPQEDN